MLLLRHNYCVRALAKAGTFREGLYLAFEGSEDAELLRGEKKAYAHGDRDCCMHAPKVLASMGRALSPDEVVAFPRTELPCEKTRRSQKSSVMSRFYEGEKDHEHHGHCHCRNLKKALRRLCSKRLFPFLSASEIFGFLGLMVRKPLLSI